MRAYLRFVYGLIFSIISLNILAAEFIASVTSQTVRAGQSFMLNLSLVDVKAKGSPDLSVLLQDFTIYSQQQYSTFSSVNGSVKSEAGWDIMLLPNHDGIITIPSISINTKEGVLKTKAIDLNVSSGTNTKSGKSNNSANNANNADKNNIGISLVATTNKAKAYVKEPIVYTLKIISYKNLMNLTLEDIKANDAIIDKVGEPKQYEQSYGGVRAHIIEIKYQITPIVAGKITITPAVIKGEMQAPRQVYHGSGRGFMLHNPFFDSMSSVEPFSLRGDKITITAIEPPIKDQNWLPLQKLTLTQEWKNLDGAKVGDTIIRKVKMVGTGTFSNQLPSVKQFVDVSFVKIYADTPSFEDKPSKDNDEVIGTKEETFTIVPTQAGKITFPEIKVSWWNLRTKKLETTTLESKTIEILPAINSASKDASVDYSQGDAEALHLNSNTNETAVISKDNTYYAVIAGLLAVIITMLSVILYLVLKKRHVVIHKQATVTGVSVYKGDNLITSINDLQRQIFLYALNSWKINAGASLAKIGSELTKNGYIYSPELFALLSEKINSGLYARATIDLSDAVEVWHSFKVSVVKDKSKANLSSDKRQKELNPT